MCGKRFVNCGRIYSTSAIKGLIPVFFRNFLQNGILNFALRCSQSSVIALQSASEKATLKGNRKFIFLQITAICVSVLNC